MTKLGEDICNLYRIANKEGNTLGRFSLAIKTLLKKYQNQHKQKVE